MEHLWEIDHPYYCNEENYLDNGYSHEYKSWNDFYHAWGDADFDMNLVFRFDWQIDPENNQIHILKIFFMGQRKGLYQSCTIQVTPADEPAVLEFLKPRWEHIKKLWEPLS